MLEKLTSQSLSPSNKSQSTLASLGLNGSTCTKNSSGRDCVVKVAGLPKNKSNLMSKNLLRCGVKTKYAWYFLFSEFWKSFNFAINATDNRKFTGSGASRTLSQLCGYKTQSSKFYLHFIFLTSYFIYFLIL